MGGGGGGVGGGGNSSMFSTKKQQQFLAWNKLGGGGARYPGWGILAPTQIYTVMTIKTSKIVRTVVKCSEKQCDQQKKTTKTKKSRPPP